ncbi:hypothetical protein DPMN_191565 [Dreissena polymorpha]|uniref:Uncharacterized protein n=1 Tax=Dreissena polymorpha TaxID=45954 RepID=A0A9D4BEE0_DREPO|nr:hypothetical protein DPMN_191565 [Dreissena polymorpha]
MGDGAKRFLTVFDSTTLYQTDYDGAKRSPRQSPTVLDTPRQWMTVPRGLPDSIRRCQILIEVHDGARQSQNGRRCQEVSQTVFDGARPEVSDVVTQ